MSESWLARMLKNSESARNVCAAILSRTIRDLRSSYKRKDEIYKQAFDWVFYYSPEDHNIPMTFAWVCDSLDIDHSRLAKLLWEMHKNDFEGSSRLLNLLEGGDVQHRRKEDSDQKNPPAE